MVDELIHNYRNHLESLIDGMVCDAGNFDGGSTENCEHCQLKRELQRVDAVLVRGENMEEGYIDGPASEPWQVVENPWSGRNEPIWWLQRHGYDARSDADENQPYEWRFGMTTDVGEDECHELVRRLNELDRLRTLAAAVSLHQEAVEGLNGIVDTERTMFQALEDWRNPNGA